MKKFVFVYDGPQTTEPPKPEVMDMWTNWFGSMGEKLVDGGNPFGSDVKSVSGSGTSEQTEELALGYSIVNAENMEQACDMASGCPNVGHDGYSVSVYEAMPM